MFLYLTLLAHDVVIASSLFFISIKDPFGYIYTPIILEAWEGGINFFSTLRGVEIQIYLIVIQTTFSCGIPYIL